MWFHPNKCVGTGSNVEAGSKRRYIFKYFNLRLRNLCEYSMLKFFEFEKHQDLGIKSLINFK